jgi:hypothetical protein
MAYKCINMYMCTVATQNMKTQRRARYGSFNTLFIWKREIRRRGCRQF